MGADLYIQGINDKWREEWDPRFEAACRYRDSLPRGSADYDAAQERVERIHREMYDNPVDDVGYFRDSYNPSSVMAFLGLSWWRDVIPLQTKKGELSVARGIPRLLAMVERREPAYEIQTYWKENKLDDTPQEWAQYFMGQQRRLIEFLTLALDSRQPIYASL